MTHRNVLCVTGLQDVDASRRPLFLCLIILTFVPLQIFCPGANYSSPRHTAH
nr:MAG TPA_asm: hypothetical protein [Caudoviricetes sp.]